MRVAIVKKLLSRVGGSEAQARALGGALVARGHAVTLVGLRPAIRRSRMPDEVYAAPPGEAVLHEGGVTYRFLPVRLGGAGALADGLLPTSLVSGAALDSAMAGAEVVHCIAREWASAAERAASRAGAAFVETPLVHPGQLFAGTGARDVARYRRDHATIALTEWEARWYRERGAPNVHVTGVGPIIAPVPAREPAIPAMVLFVGRKERYKGYDSLRAAAPLVWQRFPATRFVAIGQPSAWARFRPRHPDARWEDRGVVSEEEKADAYARCTVFAMPSSHETFGHTYLEAWCAGRPVVAGDIPPLREVVREGIDGVHAANEPRAVARAILGLLADT
ncbi:MAG: glycosyltransferase family 4 protein, partial [Chloroflexota bacterium]|nr:glycosyltransferase family 4 protein [Chloroflexota bacterium]